MRCAMQLSTLRAFEMTKVTFRNLVLPSAARASIICPTAVKSFSANCTLHSGIFFGGNYNSAMHLQSRFMTLGSSSIEWYMAGAFGLKVRDKINLGFTNSPAYALTAVRTKMVKSTSYYRPSRGSPTGQSQKAHIGVKRLSAEYVSPGALLVKQRRVLAFNLETKTRGRHVKMYPGENVGVTKDTSLVSLCHGRVKYTHDVGRDVMIVNVLPERMEELLREDLWRYRTEHVRSVEENRHLCYLRRKATVLFEKVLVNPPRKPPPRPKFLSRFDQWENETLPDVCRLDNNR